MRRSRGLDILAACGQLHLKQGASGARARPPLTPPPSPPRVSRPASRSCCGGLLALLLPYLGLGPLARAEIYFLDAARGMVESGDWIVPNYEGKPFFDKPILSYWLMAAAMNVFGTTPAAARLVPVLAALGLVVVTAWLGTLLFDRRSALAGALVLATTLAFLSFARVAMSDMLLALLSTLAVSLAVLAYRPGAPSLRGPAARGGGGARLRDQGTDRGADPRDRGPAAAVGEPPPIRSREASPGSRPARSPSP